MYMLVHSTTIYLNNLSMSSTDISNISVYSSQYIDIHSTIYQLIDISTYHFRFAIPNHTMVQNPLPGHYRCRVMTTLDSGNSLLGFVKPSEHKHVKHCKLVFSEYIHWFESQLPTTSSPECGRSLTLHNVIQEKLFIYFVCKTWHYTLTVIVCQLHAPLWS